MRKLVVGMLVGAAMLPAGQARADTWSTQCALGPTPPGYFACASAAVSFTGTQMILKVANTGVFDGAMTPQSGLGYAITGIAITAPTVADATWGDIYTGNATVVGSPNGGWEMVKYPDKLDGFTIQLGAQTTNGINYGIWGCDGTPTADYLQTCGGSKYVEFRFNTNAQYASDVAVSFAMRGQGGGVSYRCSDDPAATNGNGGCGTNTVPEPVSMVLLGSGLLGLAGARRVRRRDTKK